MNLLVHNNIVLECPDDWHDATTLVLAGPILHGFRANLSLTRRAPHASRTLASVLDEETDRLASVLPQESLRVLHDASTIAGNRPAWSRHLRVEIPGSPTPIDQLLVAADWGDQVALLTASCSADAFDSLRPRFDAVVAGLRLLDDFPVGATP